MNPTAESVVAVTGASGRLGAAVVQRLAREGNSVRALDWVDGIQPRGVDFYRADVRDERTVAAALDGVDVLVHIAGLHGAHLVAGTPREDVWKVNVDGTWRLYRQAVRSGVRRCVFASSTSVYGPGSISGEARLLDETTPLAPEDIYDQTKVLGERMLKHLSVRYDIETVALRLGRFYYGSRSDYHLRKLSTGLDLHDAAAAFARCVNAAELPHDTYCVASDLVDLSTEQRKSLGTRLPDVVAEVLPGLTTTLEFFGFTLPRRFGKATTTTLLRDDLGWAPARDIRWWAEQLDGLMLAGAALSADHRGAPQENHSET